MLHRTRLLALVTSATLTLSSAALADLDVVFLLDTTGSMGGELREAKERVTQISTALREGRGEKVRVGVVAFRDRGDAYVTQHHELTDDDKETAAFMARLNADGGGDGPEDVLSGLKVAIRDMAWSQSAERQVFLIGDAPPHLDYANHFDPDALIKEAKDLRIVVNSVGCRSLTGEGRRFFQKIAYETEGTYHHIGKVRLGQKDEGLASAMLKTLAKTERAPGEPLALTHERSDENAADRLHARLHGCALELSLPMGFGLRDAPVAEQGADGVVVQVSLREGAGGTHRYGLDRCPASTTPLHVQLN